jgi:hypothetical protein
MNNRADNYYNDDNQDIKFIPLDVNNNFVDAESPWFPSVNIDGAGFNNSITNNILYDFANPITNVKKEKDFYENIDYTGSKQSTLNEMESVPEYPMEIYKDEAYPSCQLIQDEPIHIKILREYDFSKDDYKDDNILRGNKSKNKGKHKEKSEIEDIFKMILDKDESIMKVLKLYNIPYPMASLLIKKVIALTLKYEDD